MHENLDMFILYALTIIGFFVFILIFSVIALFLLYLYKEIRIFLHEKNQKRKK